MVKENIKNVLIIGIEVILFLIYLLADKGKCQKFLFPYLLCEIVSHGQENKRLKENEIIKGFMHK